MRSAAVVEIGKKVAAEWHDPVPAKMTFVCGLRGPSLWTCDPVGYAELAAWGDLSHRLWCSPRGVVKHMRVIEASILAALTVVAVNAGAQTPNAGPPVPGAAMPAAKSVVPPPPAAKPARVTPVARATLSPVAAPKPTVTPEAAPVAASPPPVRKPAAELDQLELFDGNWKCEGKQPAGPFGPTNGYKSSFKGKKDVDNFWIAIEYEQKKSKDHPMPIKTKGFIGYDGNTKKFVNTGFDNTGGWIMETSPGWEADKLVFVGEGAMMGRKIVFRETYTKSSDKAMTWTGELKVGKDWISVGTDTCKR